MYQISLEEVAERLHMARWRRHLTLRELGEELGVQFDALWRIERGKIPKAVTNFERVREWLAAGEPAP